MIHLDRALSEAAQQFGTTIQSIQNGQRTRVTSAARQALWDVLVNDAGLTLERAAITGGIKDHTSVIYGLARAADRKDDPDYQRQRAAIRRAALGDQTTMDDAHTWLDQWPRIRAALRWHASGADADIDILDRAVRAIVTALD